MPWSDGKCRCHWADPANPAYVRYHDTEWGVPVHDDRMLFELLTLETFQAGLSWTCVLGKREALREAFDGFDPALVCRYGEEKIRTLLENPRIIRHRGKIQAAITNAGVFLSMAEEFGSFSRWLWAWTDGQTLRETGCSRSPLSDAVSGALRHRGMKFTGSVTVYSFLQAAGLLNGHEDQCFLAKPQIILK